MYTQKILGVIIILTLLHAAGRTESAAPGLTQARLYIEMLNPIIANDVRLTEEELSSTKAEFVEYYEEEVLPRLESPAQYIIDQAIHWVDVVPGGSEEIVFWTEGLSPSSWGGHEYLYVVQVTKNNASIMARQCLVDPSPSRSANSYHTSYSYVRPNSGCGYNDLVAFFLAYLSVGGSWSTASHYWVTYNRYSEVVEIDKVRLPILMRPNECK